MGGWGLLAGKVSPRKGDSRANFAGRKALPKSLGPAAAVHEGEGEVEGSPPSTGPGSGGGRGRAEPPGRRRRAPGALSEQTTARLKHASLHLQVRATLNMLISSCGAAVGRAASVGDRWPSKTLHKNGSASALRSFAFLTEFQGGRLMFVGVGRGRSGLKTSVDNHGTRAACLLLLFEPSLAAQPRIIQTGIGILRRGANSQTPLATTEDSP